LFEHVLDWLRDGSSPVVPTTSPMEASIFLKSLLKEAAFYMLPGLEATLSAAIADIDRAMQKEEAQEVQLREEAERERQRRRRQEEKGREERAERAERELWRKRRQEEDREEQCKQEERKGREARQLVQRKRQEWPKKLDKIRKASCEQQLLTREEIVLLNGNSCKNYTDFDDFADDYFTTDSSTANFINDGDLKDDGDGFFPCESRCRLRQSFFLAPHTRENNTRFEAKRLVHLS
jgi:flagellar biosynthesis GTPase FlhF